MYVNENGVVISEEPPKIGKKLAERAKKYREARKSGMTKRCAMIAAGYSVAKAGKYASKMDKIAFSDELEISGATDRNIARVINEQMSAVKPVIFEGVITDWYPDNEARRKAAELAAIYKLTPRENGDKQDLVVNYYGSVPLANIEKSETIQINPEMVTNRIAKQLEYNA